MPNDPDDRSRFDDALRRWGRREPVTPPETAARAIVRGLDSRRPTSWSFGVAAVAATVLALVAGLWFVSQDGGNGVSPATPSRAALDPESMPLADNVILWWLDDETPVYFVLDGQDPQEGEPQ